MGKKNKMVGFIPVEEIGSEEILKTMDEGKLETLVDIYLFPEWKHIKKSKNQKKIWDQGGYDEPPFYDEFRPHWGPGSSYKPWIYGK